MTMIEQAARAIAASLAKRPYGGYDYGHNEAFCGPAPEAGRYVIRCEKTDKIVHQTNDEAAHDAAYVAMTNSFHARAALLAMREPTPAMVDAFVACALQVKIGGDFTWSDYAVMQWQNMIGAAAREV